MQRQEFPKIQLSLLLVLARHEQLSAFKRGFQNTVPALAHVIVLNLIHAVAGLDDGTEAPAGHHRVIANLNECPQFLALISVNDDDFTNDFLDRFTSRLISAGLEFGVSD